MFYISNSRLENNPKASTFSSEQTTSVDHVKSNSRPRHNWPGLLLLLIKDKWINSIIYVFKEGQPPFVHTTIELWQKMKSTPVVCLCLCDITARDSFLWNIRLSIASVPLEGCHFEWKSKKRNENKLRIDVSWYFMPQPIFFPSCARAFPIHECIYRLEFACWGGIGKKSIDISVRRCVKRTNRELGTWHW